MELIPTKLAQQYHLRHESYYYWLRKIRESMCEAASMPDISNTNETKLIPV